MVDTRPESLDVTVVIPTFNRAALIVRALDSVRTQSRRPASIIVVDDASSDATVAIARAWAVHHDFPVLVDVLPKNGGAAKARNRGIELSRTQYVAFLDSDDEHEHETLERLVDGLESAPEAVVSFADGTIIEDGVSYPSTLFQNRLDLAQETQKLDSSGLGFYRLNDAQNSLLKASIIPTSGTCFRRAAAMKVDCMPENFRSGEDWLFWLRMSSQGWFVFQHLNLVRHHRHEENLTHARSGEFMAREKLRAFAGLLDGSLGVSLDDKQKRIIRSLIPARISDWRLHLSRLGISDYIKGINAAKCFTGKSLGSHLRDDPRSFSRAVLASFFVRYR